MAKAKTEPKMRFTGAKQFGDWMGLLPASVGGLVAGGTRGGRKAIDELMAREMERQQKYGNREFGNQYVQERANRMLPKHIRDSQAAGELDNFSTKMDAREAEKQSSVVHSRMDVPDSERSGDAYTGEPIPPLPPARQALMDQYRGRQANVPPEATQQERDLQIGGPPSEGLFSRAPGVYLRGQDVTGSNVPEALATTQEEFGVAPDRDAQLEAARAAGQTGVVGDPYAQTRNARGELEEMTKPYKGIESYRNTEEWQNHIKEAYDRFGHTTGMRREEFEEQAAARETADRRERMQGVGEDVRNLGASLQNPDEREAYRIDQMQEGPAKDRAMKRLEAKIEKRETRNDELENTQKWRERQKEIDRYVSQNILSKGEAARLKLQEKAIMNQERELKNQGRKLDLELENAQQRADILAGDAKAKEEKRIQELRAKQWKNAIIAAGRSDTEKAEADFNMGMNSLKDTDREAWDAIDANIGSSTINRMNFMVKFFNVLDEEGDISKGEAMKIAYDRVMSGE